LDSIAVWEASREGQKDVLRQSKGARISQTHPRRARAGRVLLGWSAFQALELERQLVPFLEDLGVHKNHPVLGETPPRFDDTLQSSSTQGNNIYVLFIVPNLRHPTSFAVHQKSWASRGRKKGAGRTPARLTPPSPPIRHH
jgi:hypothetical protein